MRSLTLSLILLAGVATHAHAQESRIMAPIAKARAAAAALLGHNKAQTDTLNIAPKPDSVPVAGAKAPAAQKPAASKPPVLPPATPSTAAQSKPGASRPAPVKPETVSANPTGQKSSSPKSADSTKAAASGKSVSAASAPGTDKSVSPVPPAQAVPGKGTTAGAKAPAASTPPAPSSKAAPVTPGAAKPSSMVEAAKDASPPTSVGSASSNRSEIQINREVFQYDAGGRRDPFVSLLSTSDLRPLFSDLLLVVINYDPQGRNSVAIMRDAATKEQYRVRQGQLIGRMRVAAIEPKRVMFTIDEFGFSRQETLVIGDTTKVRKQ